MPRTIERTDDLNEANARLQTQNRRVSALALLSQAAIAATDLDALLNEAATAAAEILGTDYAVVVNVVAGRSHAGACPLPWPENGANVPKIAADIHLDPGIENRDALAAHGITSLLGVPVRGGASSRSALIVYTRQRRVFEAEDGEFLRAVADVIGLAVRRDEGEAARRAEEQAFIESERRARADAETMLEKLQAIQSITDSTITTLTLDDLLEELLARLRRTLNCDLATVWLVREGERVLYTRAFDGWAPEGLMHVRVPFGGGISGRIVAEGRPLIFDDLATADFSGVTGMAAEEVRGTWQSVMGTPLRVGDKVIGVVCVGSRTRREYSADELNLLLIVADRVAPAIERRRLLNNAQAANERLKTLSHRLLNAQEEGRRRVAVELHDELGQLLTAAKINLESAVGPASEAARVPLAQALACVEQGMQQVRDLALNLRPSVLDDLGLAAALRWHADQFATKSRIRMHLAIDAVSKLTTILEITCFRIAQEALANVARHAHASNIWVSLRADSQGLVLTIRDDGTGYDVASARNRASSGQSMGLLAMEERAALVGGRLTMTSGEGIGSEVRLDLPIESGGRSRT